MLLCDDGFEMTSQTTQGIDHEFIAVSGGSEQGRAPVNRALKV
jgi:hypothetical protein